MMRAFPLSQSEGSLVYNGMYRRILKTPIDPRELAYIEHRGLDGPTRFSHDSDDGVRLKVPRPYHSRLSGEGLFGISAYGLIVLATLFVTCLLLFFIIRLLAKLLGL